LGYPINLKKEDEKLRERNVIRKGLVFKLSIILFVALFACILLGSTVAEGSGVKNEGSAAELELGSYVDQHEGTAPAYVARNSEFSSISANFISGTAIGNMTLVFILTLLVAVFIATFMFSPFKKRNNKVKRMFRFCLVIILIFAVFSVLPVGISVTEIPTQNKLFASDAFTEDMFGHSVSMSEDTLVVGAPGNDDGGNSSGSAYVFIKSGDTWTELAKLTASDAATEDKFGYSVSISGDTIVVGARNDDGEKGSAYVFVRPETGWTDKTEDAKLTASDGEAGDWFGRAVSINEDTIVVGAVLDESYEGSAYVFIRPETGWTDNTEDAKLTANDAVFNDMFGSSVSISGDTIVVGAIYGNSERGSAYVFVRPETGWTNMTENAELSASDAEEWIKFGSSVSISGDTIVVGAHYMGLFDFLSSAYVFERPETGWADNTEDAKLTASDAELGQYFGYSVSINEDTIVVGASEHYLYGGKGSAYVYKCPETGWSDKTEDDKLIASDGVVDDEFGYSVFINGDIIVAGAVGDNNSMGSVYWYDMFPSTVYVDDDWSSNLPGDIVDGHTFGYDAFAAIQDGVDAVEDDGTVIVYAGTYNENIIIEKTLTLLGDDRDTPIIQGFGSGYGIHQHRTSDVTIKNFNIKQFINGIYLYYSRDSTIIGNTISDNSVNGIQLTGYLDPLGNPGYSSNNIITENIISENGCGINLDTYTSNNNIYFNNIIENEIQAEDSGTNTWDNGESEGNYWSDYQGLDCGDMTYPWDSTGKHEIAGDGIGDTLVPHPLTDYDYYPYVEENGWMRVHNIEKDLWYSTIQLAVDDANPENTLWARNGLYNENVIITKPLTLQGEDRETTIIDGSSSGDVVRIEADSVEMTGFTITGSGSNWNDAGIEIYIAWPGYCKVEACDISNNQNGIYLFVSNNNNIIGNNVSQNSCGINLWSSESNTISENIISNNDCGNRYIWPNLLM
jgi:parallel beta-helix repeat protein